MAAYGMFCVAGRALAASSGSIISRRTPQLLSGLRPQAIRPLQTQIKNSIDISKARYPILNAVRQASSVVKPAGNHNTIWVAEKVLSLGLIGLIPLAIACPSKALDSVLAVGLVTHIYWGFEAIVKDYVRVILFGQLIPKLAQGMLVAAMIATLGGLFYVIFNDIGLAGTFRKFWAIKPKA